jgi:hypothetical protein
MLLHCHGRKCNTTRDHKLKVDTAEILCMDCLEPNLMVSDFMKNAMKTSGDIYRAAGQKKGFMYKCPKCTVDRAVKIVDEQALCTSCSHPLNLSAPMLQAIKLNGTKTSADDDDEMPESSELNKGVIKRSKKD